jgi:hypothetical protein
MKSNKPSYIDDKMNLINYIMTNDSRFINNLINNSLNDNCNFYVSRKLCKDSVNTNAYSNDTMNDKLKKLIEKVIKHYKRPFSDLAMINFYKLSNSVGVHVDTSYCDYTFNFKKAISVISLVDKYPSNVVLIDALEYVELIYDDMTKYDILCKHSFIEFDLKKKHALINNLPILIMACTFKDNS